MNTAIVVRDPSGLQAQALAEIDTAIRIYQPSRVFALFSGGHDSLSVTHVVAQHPAFSGVIHINTGTGIPETNQFVRDTCIREGWPLHELHPPWLYEQLIVRYGFPGPPSHGFMYRYLKERPLGRFVQTQKRRIVGKQGKSRPDPKDCIALVGGMRSQESVRRMGHVEPLHKAGAHLWISPIHNWTAYEVGAYISFHALPRNPVKDRLHISGECLCGSYADENELHDIDMWYPATAARIRIQQSLVALASQLLPIHPRARRWGNGGPSSTGAIPLEQRELFPMCHYCTVGREVEAEVA